MPSQNRLFTLFGNFTGKPGTVPGSFENLPQKHSEPVTIDLYHFDKNTNDHATVNSIEEYNAYLQTPTKTWIQIQGLGEINKLKTIWSHFGLHPLIQEDIINTVQRPKVEWYNDCIFIVMRVLRYVADQEHPESEQISLVLGKNYLLSFQETNQPVFHSVIERLNTSNSRIRTAGIDYLAYALLDAATDHYFSFLDDLNEQLEQIEEELLDRPDEDTLKQIHSVRKDIVMAHKSAWPARDMLQALTKEDVELVSKKSRPYFRDVYDHIVQIIYNIENFRETSMSMYDMYMSESSRKMNEIMKVLTIIATIFIPLTFIAGIYGMNFNTEKSPLSMPELNWYWGYPACLVVMFVVAVIMIFYFKRKDWW